MMRSVSIFFAAMLVVIGPVQAKERKLSVYGFDAIQIIGNVNVSVVTGKGPSAVAEADTQRMLDRISLRKAGSELVVSVRALTDRRKRFSSEQPIELRLTTNDLQKVVHRGSGSVTIDKLAGRNTSARVGGFGSLTIGTVDSDRLEISMNGGGELIVGGEARMAKISLLGSSTLSAGMLTVGDLDLAHRGPANTQINVEKRAEITNNGTGAIRIDGRPDCLVRSVGSADIICNPKN